MTFTGYLEELRRILTRIEQEDAPAIQAAATLIAESLSRGGIVHIFGSGHSHMIAEEAFYRAGGLAAVNPILDPRLLFLEGAMESTRAEREMGYARQLLEREDVRPGDVGIVVSNSGRNAAPVEMAMELKSRGAEVIAITNVEQSCCAPSRHVSGKRLFEVAGVVIDNCVPAGDAVARIDGLPLRVGPASTVAGAAIINSVIIEAVSQMARNGVTPDVFASANLTTTPDADLERILARHAGRIRYFRMRESRR